MWRYVYKDFSELDRKGQLALFKTMEQDLFRKSSNKLDDEIYEMMINGLTLPKIAEQLNIHISTASYWRHKVLNDLDSHGFEQLSGIVKSDETFFRESLKGRQFTLEKLKNVEKKMKKEVSLI